FQRVVKLREIDRDIPFAAGGKRLHRGLVAALYRTDPLGGLGFPVLLRFLGSGMFGLRLGGLPGAPFILFLDDAFGSLHIIPSADQGIWVKFAVRAETSVLRHGRHR